MPQLSDFLEDALSDFGGLCEEFEIEGRKGEGTWP
jgi:hypothetical protein